MMGLLGRIGIQKSMPFKRDTQTENIYEAAATEALQYMIEQYHKVLNPPVYEGKKWSSLTPPGVRETGFTYEFANRLNGYSEGVGTKWQYGCSEESLFS